MPFCGQDAKHLCDDDSSRSLLPLGSKANKFFISKNAILNALPDYVQKKIIRDSASSSALPIERTNVAFQ